MVERPPDRTCGLGRGGFTLFETIVASMFGLFVLLLALGVVQVHARLQTRIEESVASQSVLSFAGSVVAEEVGPITRGSIVYARSNLLVFRRPLLIGQFCARTSSHSYLYLPLDGATLPSARIGGIAIQNGTEWTYIDVPWGEMGITFSTAAAAQCAAAGTDTTGIRNDFAGVAVPAPLGTVVSLYQLRTVVLAPSLLDPDRLALFVGGTGEEGSEVATGLAVGTHLSYRHNDGRYLTSPTSGELQWLDGVRFTAVSGLTRRPDAPEASWIVDVRLPNVTF